MELNWRVGVSTIFTAARKMKPSLQSHDSFHWFGEWFINGVTNAISYTWGTIFPVLPLRGMEATLMLSKLDETMAAHSRELRVQPVRKESGAISLLCCGEHVTLSFIAWLTESKRPMTNEKLIRFILVGYASESTRKHLFRRFGAVRYDRKNKPESK